MTLAGMVVGAVAFGAWQHSVAAAIFVLSLELGAHWEARQGFGKKEGSDE